MADNIFALLQQAWSAARTEDANIFGVEIAIVTNVQDPEKQGRVKICLPRLPGKPESDWARVAQPGAGDGRGFYWVPAVNDEVLVAFERGQANHPYVIGSVWNGKDKPMKDAYTDENTKVMVQTASGHQIILEDKGGEESMVIADKSGKRSITWNVKDKKLLIEAGEGDVEFHAAKKIVLSCEDLEIKTKKTGKLEIGKTFDLKVAQKAGFKAGPQMNLKADKVNLNPPSLDLAALAAAALAAAARAAAAAAGANAEQQQQAAQAGAAAGAALAGGAPADLVPTKDVADAAGAAAGAAADAAGKAGGALDGTDWTKAKDGAAGDAGGASGTAAPGTPGAAADAATTGATPAAAAAGEAGAVAPNDVAVQLVSHSGAPKSQVEVELVLPSGEKRAGRTDDKGVFKAEKLAETGAAKLSIPDVQAAGADPAEGHVKYTPPSIDVPIGKSTVVEVPPVVRRCRLQGLHFETNKTFLLPSAMPGMRQLVKIFGSFPDLATLVSGHADKQGTAQYNLGLSRERADAIRAFLVDDAAAWQPFYKGTRTSGAWGVREDQFMLANVRDSSGAPFYAGPIDGQQGPLTSDAYRAFQHSRLLGETGKPDADTRLELARAYMALEGTSLPKGAKIETHGCGQTHPLPETAGDPNPDQPKNRRVEVFLFDGEVQPPPVDPCPSGGCAEYPQWVALKTLDVDLDQPPGALTVVVTDDAGNPLPKAAVHLSGPVAQDGETDSGGVAPFGDLPAGTYKVIAEKDGFAAADTSVDVASGGAAAPAPKADAKGLVAFSAPAGLGGVLLQLKGATVAKIELTVQLKTNFVLASAPTVSRWPGAPGMLKDALVSVDSGTPVKTDATGLAKLDVTPFIFGSGKHTLTIQPDPTRLNSGGEAGPALGTGALTDPAFMYRPISLPVEFDGSGLKTVTSPAKRTGKMGQKTVTLPDHFIVVSFAPTSLVIDWKPDWMRHPTPDPSKVFPNNPKAVVVHQSTSPTIGSDIGQLVFGPVSSHYLVDVDGFVVKIVHETKAAAHVGGKSAWMGVSNLTQQSIGIEQTHSDAGGNKPFPDDQVAGTMRLVRAILDARKAAGKEIVRQAVAGHGEVEPGGNGIVALGDGRDIFDPGETFEWKALEDFGVARTRGTPPSAPIYGLNPGDKPITTASKPSAAIEELQDDLKTIGYSFAAPKKVFNGAISQIVRRFQARFWAGSLQSIGGWAGGVPFALNQFVVNGGNVFVCTKAGTSANQTGDDAGPKGTGTGIKDGTAEWAFDHLDFGPRPKLGEVDFPTAKAIKQVLADAPATVTVNATPANPPNPTPTPTPTPGPVKSGLVEEGSSAQDQSFGVPGEPIEPPPDSGSQVFHDGDTVRISWDAKGDFDKLVLDPGGIELPGASGSQDVVVRRADAVDNAVTFQVSALLGEELQTAKAGAVAAAGAAAIAAAARVLCDLTPNLAPEEKKVHCIPARTDPAMTGTAFMKLVAGVKTAADRDKEVVKQVLAGNIPDFLRKFVKVPVSGGGLTGFVYVAPDYLAIGTDADFVRVPLLPKNAQAVVDACCCMLPTAKITDAIYNAKGTVQIDPVSVTNNPGVQNGEVTNSNAAIEKKLAALAAKGAYKQGDLTTGPKKDIVVSILLKKIKQKGQPIGTSGHVHHSDDAVVIYGWHQPNPPPDKNGVKPPKGTPIQGEFDGHDKNYEDYSHGIRLVSQTMTVTDASGDTDGPVADVLKDAKKALLICRDTDVKAPEFPVPAKYP